MIIPDSDLHSEVYKLVKAAVDKNNRLEEENANENGNGKVHSSSTSPSNAIYDVYMCVDEMEIEDEGVSEKGNTRDLVYEELVKQENAAILCYTELSYIA